MQLSDCACLPASRLAIPCDCGVRNFRAPFSRSVWCGVLRSCVVWRVSSLTSHRITLQEVSEYEKRCPQVWCVVGNCFSLQKEHEMALKFFQVCARVCVCAVCAVCVCVLVFACMCVHVCMCVFVHVCASASTCCSGVLCSGE